MLTAGSILKKERLRKNYSLDEVAAATKIQKHYIDAMEKNHFSLFPSSVYAKGFLQNYAKYLQVNPGKVLALYRRSVGEAKSDNIKKGPQIQKQPRFVLTPGVIIVTTVIILALAVLGYLIYQFYNFQKPPFLELTNPESNTTVIESELELKGITEPGMFVTINDEAVKVSQDGKFEVTITLSKGTNTIIVKSRHPDNTGKEAVLTRNIEYKTDDGEDESHTDETNQADEEPQPPASTSILMTISVDLENAWIEVFVDETQELAAIVTPGTSLDFTGEESIFVITGKVSATKITVNGEPHEMFIGDAGVASILCEFNDNQEIDCHQP